MYRNNAEVIHDFQNQRAGDIVGSCDRAHTQIKVNSEGSFVGKREEV